MIQEVIVKGYKSIKDQTVTLRPIRIPNVHEHGWL